jgi:squalene-associated FAD-dependent desaturase
MPSSEVGTVHIIGAGLAGLSAAVRLAGAGRAVVVHEATAFAGGRCRTYVDVVTGMEIDNGSHLVLSGNQAALGYARTIGGADGLVGPASADFDFFDLASKARWTVRINDGVIPWWLLDKRRRVPDTRLADYLPLAKIAWASGDKPLGDVMDCSGTLYQRLVAPLFLAALNIEPLHGSTKLAGALVRETLAAGGKACRPLIARDGVGKVFVEPALAYLAAHGARVQFEHGLHALRFNGDRVAELVFANDAVALGPADRVIMAVPAYAAAGFLPGLDVPTAYRGIVNVHFHVDPAGKTPRMVGLINATSEWVFAFPGRVAVTISDGSRLFEEPRAELAARIWREVAAALDLPAEPLPTWQIVRERRATFAATPEENAKRPGAATRWPNLVLAGDWTATGLPATIEGAIRSGNRAADLIGSVKRAAA